MNMWYRVAAVTAQAEWYRRFRLRSTADAASILAMLALLAIVVMGVWVASRWFQARERRRSNCPRALFRELCRAHGLSSGDRNLLLRLASQQNPYNPAAIFLDPQCFEADQLPPAAVGDIENVKRLRELLFGSLARPSSTTRR